MSQRVIPKAAPSVMADADGTPPSTRPMPCDNPQAHILPPYTPLARGAWSS